MEALQQLFKLLTDDVPKFCASMILNFLTFFVRPYTVARVTIRTLSSRQITSVALVVFFCAAFAMVLGLPSSGNAILGVDGGVTRSLQQIWHLDIKAKIFFYLLIFVALSTTITIIICYICRGLLPMPDVPAIPAKSGDSAGHGDSIVPAISIDPEVPAKSVEDIRARMLKMRHQMRIQFFDLFNIFIAFGIGWFMLSSVLVNALLKMVSWKGTDDKEHNLLSSWQDWVNHKLSVDPSNPPEHEDIFQTVTQIMFQPALIILLLWTFYVSYSLFNKWVARNKLWVGRNVYKSRSLLETVRRGKPITIAYEIARRRVYIYPAIAYIVIVLCQAILLAYLVDALYGEIEGANKITIVASCELKSAKGNNQFVISSLIENKTIHALPIHALFIRMKKKDSERTSLDKGVRIEGETLALASEKGALLDGGEKRFYHFIVTLGSSSWSIADGVWCESQNDSSGGFDDDQNHKIVFSPPDKVIGDSYSVNGTVEQE